MSTLADVIALVTMEQPVSPVDSGSLMKSWTAGTTDRPPTPPPALWKSMCMSSAVNVIDSYTGTLPATFGDLRKRLAEKHLTLLTQYLKNIPGPEKN